jgi:hypothetical protein
MHILSIIFCVISDLITCSCSYLSTLLESRSSARIIMMACWKLYNFLILLLPTNVCVHLQIW